MCIHTLRDLPKVGEICLSTQKENDEIYRRTLVLSSGDLLQHNRRF